MDRSRLAFVVLAAAFAVSRVAYFLLGVEFNAAPLGFYLQYVDPVLLKTAFWQSLYYLKEQPPGYNFFLGVVLQAFPNHAEAAFRASSMALGFAMTGALFSIIGRMGAPPRIALAVAVAFAASPVSVLYENWLFYAYPMTALLVFAALFLHRYATLGRAADGFLFFMCLALLGMIRTVFHPALLALATILLLWARPVWRRRTIAVAALPALLLGGLYVKHFLLFGGFVIGGDVFQPTNLVLMTMSGLPSGALEELEVQGAISPLLRRPVYDGSGPADPSLVPPPAPTGIPVLDTTVKSSGAANWNSLWMGRVGLQYRKDALAILRAHPGVYARNVLSNAARHVKAPHWGWPFDGNAHPNMARLGPLLAAASWITTGTSSESGVPWWSGMWVPGLLLFGLWYVVRGHTEWRRAADALPDATVLTVLFAVSVIVYTAAVTICFSAGDHHRYRDEVSGLFAVLLGLALTEASRAWEARRRSSGVPHSRIETTEHGGEGAKRQ